MYSKYVKTLFLYNRTRYMIVYTTKLIQKYMLCNVSSGGGGGILFLYDRTRYTIIYTTKVIQKYMISNVTFSEGGIVFIRSYTLYDRLYNKGHTKVRGGHCFYTNVHAMQCKLGRGGGRI